LYKRFPILTICKILVSPGFTTEESTQRKGKEKKENEKKGEESKAHALEKGFGAGGFPS
jgi:hypothetical protein